ncbi:MAG: hypothetical protein LCI02_24625 [Proteobacteria bacterium]|nr:hypothetical protein [Pseudomonadota bacterium]
MSTSRKLLCVAALAATGLLAGLPAHAGERVQWSLQIGLPLPPLPLPLVVASAPRVVAAPVYREPVYTAPVYAAPLYAAPPPVVWHRRHDDRRAYGYGYGYDRDHDGIPNRYDRHDNRLDGRGVDRDRDGIPDWRDRRDNRRW